MRDIKPTEERLAKGDITERLLPDGAQGASAVRLCASGAVYALHRAGYVADAHIAAAEKWARDYETGVLGARDPEAKRLKGRPDPECAILSRMSASARCRYVRDCLGRHSEMLLFRIMIDGSSLATLAQHLHDRVGAEGRPYAGATRHDRLRVAGMLALLLEQLAEIYCRMPDGLLVDWAAVPCASSG